MRNHWGKVVRSFRAFTRELSRVPSVAPPSIQVPQRPRLGLALGGGFARGAAHIGVLKVLEEEGIELDFIAGTSVGSVVGASYCSGVSARELQEISSMMRFRDFARWTLSRYGLCNNDRMESLLARIVKVKTFEELRIPLAVSATDFVTGEPVTFCTGPLIEPVRASCAYPGMFLPVNMNGRLLVDGMLGHAVPTTPLRQMGAEKVIGVYLSAHWVRLEGPRHLFDVIGQCFSIAQARMSSAWKADADLVLEPDVDGFAYDAFERTNELIVSGENAIRAALPTIRKWIEVTERQPKAKIAKPSVAPQLPSEA